MMGGEVTRLRICGVCRDGAPDPVLMGLTEAPQAVGTTGWRHCLPSVPSLGSGVCARVTDIRVVSGNSQTGGYIASDHSVGYSSLPQCPFSSPGIVPAWLNVGPGCALHPAWSCYFRFQQRESADFRPEASGLPVTLPVPQHAARDTGLSFHGPVTTFPLDIAFFSFLQGFI